MRVLYRNNMLKTVKLIESADISINSFTFYIDDTYKDESTPVALFYCLELAELDYLAKEIMNQETIQIIVSEYVVEIQTETGVEIYKQTRVQNETQEQKNDIDQDKRDLESFQSRSKENH